MRLALLALTAAALAVSPASSWRVGRKGNTTANAGVAVFTRFNCAFPFCPETALDICSADEHYEPGRPNVIATLIPMTPTPKMAFFAHSDFDNSTRLHYTLAARQADHLPLNQLFTVYINLTGTGGYIVNEVNVTLPDGFKQHEITYFFTYKGLVYITFSAGAIVSVNPATGAMGNVTSLLPADGSLFDNEACSFDASTGTFWANAMSSSGPPEPPPASRAAALALTPPRSGATDNSSAFYLHSYNVDTGAQTQLGPLPAAPGTSNTTGGPRLDWAVSQLVVYPPGGGAMQLLEMRTSLYEPFLFMAFIDPTTGNSTVINLPEQWYLNWEIDPQSYVTQWQGSTRRVWSYDPINNYAWFKLYDECGGTDECTEDENLVFLDWSDESGYVDWYQASGLEPELTQLIWVWTPQIEAA